MRRYQCVDADVVQIFHRIAVDRPGTWSQFSGPVAPPPVPGEVRGRGLPSSPQGNRYEPLFAVLLHQQEHGFAVVFRCLAYAGYDLLGGRNRFLPDH